MGAPPIPVLPDLSLLSDRDKITAIQEYVSSHARFPLALALIIAVGIEYIIRSLL